MRCGKRRDLWSVYVCVFFGKCCLFTLLLRKSEVDERFSVIRNNIAFVYRMRNCIVIVLRISIFQS